MTDILLDGFDLAFENGDFLNGDSDEQHQLLLLIDDKGDFKETPTACVGVERWLKDDDAIGMLGEIKKEYERDGMTVKKIELTKEGKLNINASY